VRESLLHTTPRFLTLGVVVCGTMSVEARANLENQITQKQQEYEERVQQIEALAADRRAALIEPVMQRINAVIEDMRAEGNYVLIFDLSAGAILAADSALDLTQEVIARLRSN
jgi:Skp family chaperone for outer membrane proteins